MNADLTFERWGDDGWAFSDPIGRTSATLLVYPFEGGHAFAEVATVGTPDDEDLPARVLAGLADEVVALRAEIERLLREQAEFTGAALCALGLNRDEYVSPGDQVLDEINRLTTKVSELTRLLAKAEHDRDLHQNLSERLKLALRMPGTGSYVEWAAACRDAVDRLAEAEEAIRNLAWRECSDCGGTGSLGSAVDGRQVACESCYGSEDRRGDGWLPVGDNIEETMYSPAVQRALKGAPR